MTFFSFSIGQFLRVISTTPQFTVNKGEEGKKRMRWRKEADHRRRMRQRKGGTTGGDEKREGGGRGGREGDKDTILPHVGEELSPVRRGG